MLVLKCVNGEQRLSEFEELRLAAAEREDIVVLNARVDASTRDALMSSCDCFVSLHRSEGFGRGLSEAMALAKPVISPPTPPTLPFPHPPTGRVQGGI